MICLEFALKHNVLEDSVSYNPIYTELEAILYHTGEVNVIEGFEGDIVKEFHELIKKENIFCAYNLWGFHLPYICKKFIKYGLEVPAKINVNLIKPWEANHLKDLMRLWSFGAQADSFDSVCTYLWDKKAEAPRERLGLLVELKNKLIQIKLKK